MGVFTGMALSAVVGGVASSKAADAQAGAAQQGADAQLQANTDNIEFQKWLFGEQTALNEPWQEAGLKAMDRYASSPGFKFSYDDMTADPGYQFRKEEGIKALDRSASARGNVLSGGQNKAVLGYGQDMASQEYQNAFNRSLTGYNANMNKDANLMNIGRGATAATQNAGSQMGQAVGQSTINSGNALAQGYQQAGAAQAQGYAGMASAANTGMSNYLTYNMLGQQTMPQSYINDFNTNGLG